MTEKEYNLCVTKYADNVYRFIIKDSVEEEIYNMNCIEDQNKNKII